MGTTSLDNSQVIGSIVFSLLVILLSTPILYVLKMWAYDTTVKKMRKAWRKRRLEKQASGENHSPFFILDRQRVRGPKRYAVYYYGYLLVVVALILSMWLRACNILINATHWFLTSKLLLDAIIAAAYLRQTRHQK